MDIKEEREAAAEWEEKARRSGAVGSIESNVTFILAIPLASVTSKNVDELPLKRVVMTEKVGVWAMETMTGTKGRLAELSERT